MASPALPTGAVVVEDGGLADPLLAADGNGATKTKECGAEGKYWVAADEAERRAVTECGAEDGRPLLFRTYKLRGRNPAPLQVPRRAAKLNFYLLAFICMHTRVRNTVHVLLEAR